MKTWLTVCILLTACSDKNEKTGVAQDSVRVVQDSPPDEKPQLLTYEQRQGKHLYAKYCAVCHGTEGKGDGFNAYNLDPKPRDFTDSQYMDPLSDPRLLETISQGGRGVNKSVLMPSWGGRLSNTERTYIAAFVRYLGKRTD
jgi:mono/diheme cytochrome c family protein